MKRPAPEPIPLFEDVPSAERADEARLRLRTFAAAVGRRHRRSKAGVTEFVSALRGYHRTLGICAETQIPPLDENALRDAISVYVAVRANRHTAAA